MDVLRGWPDRATAHIGLLQVHPSRQRQGVGRRAHDLLLAELAGWSEVTTLRAAIVGTNAAEAEPFWTALGYRPAEPPRPYRAGSTDTHVTAWTRPILTAGPGDSPHTTPQPPRRPR
ncbi:GNAT family N-acetyltransferase [Nocardioides panacisoli]|uniref:GNAT family N-acetyltransferase n=1 Tax=Nocardioides panacisoli TaxID=627624 RepID=UPI003CD066AD